jgi:large subunit ribosomal protein L46
MGGRVCTRFVSFSLVGAGEGLRARKLIKRKAAERVLVQTAGLNMNTWLVGHAPIGHYITNPRINEDSSLTKPGEKTFFMKARIMAGQANLQGNIYGLEDFKWLTKQEVEKHVGLKYYSWVKNMLADR